MQAGEAGGIEGEEFEVMGLLRQPGEEFGHVMSDPGARAAQAAVVDDDSAGLSHER
jgi:hypothetical protein